MAFTLKKTYFPVIINIDNKKDKLTCILKEHFYCEQ